MSEDQRQRPDKPQKPVINLDADEQNASWLRILEQERQQREQPEQQQPPEKETDR